MEQPISMDGLRFSMARSGVSESERQLTAEVEDLKRIHALSLRLAAAHTLSDVLIDVLRSAGSLVGAPFGSVQLLTPEGHLGMVGQIGFGDAIVDQFSTVRLEDCSTCSVALKRRSRVVVADLRADPTYTEIAAALRSYGVVAAVSTPVLDIGGNVLAMFSLYWREEHEPGGRELRALDLCAELAGRHVERSFAEARQAMLMRELAHRGRNLLSVVQAIAKRTLSGERTLEDACKALIGRLQALSIAYTTLVEDAPESASLTEIVSVGLQAFSGRVSIKGPPLTVPARHAQTLSLVIHELATNAAKYGALSAQSGCIDVSWEIIGAGTTQLVSFKWLERGGPPANPPTRRGFGSAIITTLVGNELKCTPTLDYTQDGFRYRLEFPLSAPARAGA